MVKRLKQLRKKYDTTAVRYNNIILYYRHSLSVWRVDGCVGGDEVTKSQ